MVYEFQIDSSIISNFLHMRISKFMWKKIESIFLKSEILWERVLIYSYGFR